MMTRLLVPLDGSEEARDALPYAMALAVPGTEIILLTVIPAADEITGASGEMVVPADGMSSVAVDRARDALAQAAARLRLAGHAVQTQVAIGDPAERIIETARDSGTALIVMASHGRGALGRLIYGSVADRVAREAPAPTMVVRTRQLAPGPVGITRLVVPLDGTSFAEQSLSFAAEISRRLGTPILLVQAVNPLALMPPTAGFVEAMPAEVYDQTAEQMERDASEYLEGVATRLRGQGLRVVTQVLNGPPAAIMEATRLGDVLVLCSHERSGVQRWLLGSVSEQLVRGDEAPVILVPATEHPEATG
jgi:nucleotide-binding universal stress UspA family protein